MAIIKTHTTRRGRLENFVTIGKIKWEQRQMKAKIEDHSQLHARNPQTEATENIKE